MKKILLNTMMVLGFTLNANAQTFMNSTQLNTYKSSISYMACSYAGNTNCYGATSLESARKIVTELKDMQATGLNASKKRDLDKSAEQVLLMITPEEVKSFMKSFSNTSVESYANAIADNALIQSKITIPGEQTLANAEKGIYAGKGMNEDSVTTVLTTTKKEILAGLKTKAEAPEEYSVRPAYLKGIEYTKAVGNDVDVKLLENKTLAVVSLSQEEEANGLSMKTVSETKMEIRRSASENYNLKIHLMSSTVKSTIDENVYDDSKRPVIDPKANIKVTEAYKIDEKWVNRYAAEEKALATDRDFDSNKLLLGYVVDSIEKLNKKAAATTNPKAKEMYNKKAAKAYADGKVYYNTLAKNYTDRDGAKELMQRYITVKVSK